VILGSKLNGTARFLYGTTYSGGGGVNPGGTVFQLDWYGSPPSYTVLHTFGSSSGADGNEPAAGLIQDSSGNLYGTTSDGGNGNGGTVFEVSAAGVETILYQFTGGTDGGTPYAGLVRDAAGNLYGTTLVGGDSAGCGGAGCGVVFKVTPAGQESVLYAFTGPDGASPSAGLVQDPAGNLYGTTYQGGAHGLGTVFKLDTAGKLTILHHFAGGEDGANPTAPLIRGAGGKLYGTTALGGSTLACPAGCGTVFGVWPTGGAFILHRFTGGLDGAYPQSGLLAVGSDFYGATYAGGYNDAGVIFKLTPP
jgi:uncharacterized repeat protein (TIGR03803 family)